MSWAFPSQHCPRLPWYELPMYLRAMGRPRVEQWWVGLWNQGVAAGRVEGAVGTLLAVLVLVVFFAVLWLIVRRR